MGHANTSVDAVREFWEWGREKGYALKGTANDVLSALRAVTEDLEPDEKANLLNLDADDVFRRFLNKKGRKLGLATQREYRLRFMRAMDAYRAFQADPTRWPSMKKSRANVAREKASAGRAQTLAHEPNAKSPEPQAGQVAEVEREVESDASAARSNSLTYPFPLRPGVTVIIQRLPADLKRSEADRLAAFLRSLSEDYRAE